MDSKKTIKVYTTSSGAELDISAPDTMQVINATNNRAQYFAEQAKKFRDEAKKHSDNAQYYAEQNSDVTTEYINKIKNQLQNEIAAKQDLGDYALRVELPVNVSELENDAKYINQSEFTQAILDVTLPAQESCAGKFLMTDGKDEVWVGLSGFNLFDTKLSDRVLNYEESKGWALQGTYVYKNSIAGVHYGYPDFYNKVLEEFSQATTLEDINGVNVKVHSNGHKFYDIADKTLIDDLFNNTGLAWLYGVDTENECIFLPRNSYFDQATADISEVGKSIEAGLPNITGDNYQVTAKKGEVIANGAFYISGESGYGFTEHSGGGTYPKVTLDASLSSPIYGNSNTVQPNSVKKLLYICVGNTTNYEGMTEVVSQGMEILEQVNSGISQVLATRVELDGSNATFPHIIQTYQNGSSWYRIYSDNWCEQGGYVGAADTTVTYLKPFRDTLYTLVAGLIPGEISATWEHLNLKNQTTTSFYYDSQDGYALKWMACGYIA